VATSDGFTIQPTAALAATDQFAASTAKLTGLATINPAVGAVFAVFGSPVAGADASLTAQLSASLAKLGSLFTGIGTDLVKAIEGYVNADNAVAASLGGTPQTAQTSTKPKQGPLDHHLEQQIPPHGSRSAGLGDYTEYTEMKAIELGLRAKGYTHAADMLDHYLGNSGSTVNVDPKQLMTDNPSFGQKVSDTVAANRGQSTFDSGWVNYNADLHDANGKFNGSESYDWYYAMHDFRYRVTGTNTVDASGQTVTNYNVDVYKPYIFGGPNRSPLTIPHTGIKLSQDDMQGLHDAGLAQDFLITGRSTFSNTQ